MTNEGQSLSQPLPTELLSHKLLHTTAHYGWQVVHSLILGLLFRAMSFSQLLLPILTIATYYVTCVRCANQAEWLI